MGKKKSPATTKSRSEKPTIAKALADADPMAIYAETTRWKDKCADLLDVLRGIKSFCEGLAVADTSDIDHIEALCDKTLTKFTNQRE